ncbi:MAG TPA: hypothetical protein VFC29_08110 [Candidatus Limnocylindrales bacterium]|nr:hypothetical protein [Candidatus Limnocylindrales bacterium]
MGKAKGEGRAKEGCPEENGWSEAHESSHAEEIVGVDEGTVGGFEEGDINRNRFDEVIADGGFVVSPCPFSTSQTLTC